MAKKTWDREKKRKFPFFGVLWSVVMCTPAARGTKSVSLSLAYCNLAFPKLGSVPLLGVSEEGVGRRQKLSQVGTCMNDDDNRQHPPPPPCMRAHAHTHTSGTDSSFATSYFAFPILQVLPLPSVPILLCSLTPVAISGRGSGGDSWSLEEPKTTGGFYGWV